VSPEELDAKWYALDFAVGRSIRYHQKRCATFEWFDTGNKVLSMLAGAGAFLFFVDDHSVTGRVFALIVVALQIGDLAIRYDERKRKHVDAIEKFHFLAERMRRNSPPTEKAYNRFAADRLAVERTAPQAITALDMICYNVEAEARDADPDDLRYVRRYQRWFSWLFTLPPDDFPTMREWNARYPK
jgi:hypothetical protein